MIHTTHKSRHFFLICFSLALITLAVYWQIIGHEFINYDDPKYVTENPRVQAGLTVQGVKWAFTTSHGGYWHPLTWLSHMLDCRLFGLNPAGHHLVNLLFHVANTLLLFLVFHRMTQAPWRSAFVAALFALHPLHVESVAWVAERKDVLSAFFFMLTMGAYTWYAERRGIRRYIPVVVFFALGLMSKPMVVTLPFVLLLLDYWPLRRLESARPAVPHAAPASGQKNQGRKKQKAARDYPPAAVQNENRGMLPQGATVPFLILEKIPLLALSVLSSIITFSHQKKEGAMAGLQTLPLGDRAGNALISYVSYLEKMIWPEDLAVFYPYPVEQPVWHVFGAVLVLAVITIPAVGAAKRFPWLAVGWFWFLGTLMPVIGLVQVGMQAMADRYTYISFIGLFIVVAWGALELLNKWRFPKAVFATAAGVVVMVLSVVTYSQIRHWQSSITLFRHAVSVTADNTEAHVNLGNALNEKARIEEASGHFREAIRINPRYPTAYLGLGIALFRKSDTEGAIALYREAIRIKPDYGAAYAALGDAFLFQGMLQEAVVQYQKAIMLGPADVWTHFNLGVAFYQMGQAEEAVTQFRKAILAKPDYAKAYNALGGILVGQGKMEEAIGYFKEAIRIDPGYGEARDNLKRALSMDNK